MKLKSFYKKLFIFFYLVFSNISHSSFDKDEHFNYMILSGEMLSPKTLYPSGKRA